MHLRILLPFHVFAEKDHVSRIVVETRDGSYGLLPHRLDCVAALVPGILTYELAGAAAVFVAVDEGVLVKVGREVLISVRRAIGGADLSQLRDLVEQQYLNVDASEQAERSTMAKLESGFLLRFASLQQ